MFSRTRLRALLNPLIGPPRRSILFPVDRVTLLGTWLLRHHSPHFLVVAVGASELETLAPLPSFAPSSGLLWVIPDTHTPGLVLEAFMVEAGVYSAAFEIAERVNSTLGRHAHFAFGAELRALFLVRGTETYHESSFTIGVITGVHTLTTQALAMPIFGFNPSSRHTEPTSTTSTPSTVSTVASSPAPSAPDSRVRDPRALRVASPRDARHTPAPRPSSSSLPIFPLLGQLPDCARASSQRSRPGAVPASRTVSGHACSPLGPRPSATSAPAEPQPSSGPELDSPFASSPPLPAAVDVQTFDLTPAQAAIVSARLLNADTPAGRRVANFRRRAQYDPHCPLFHDELVEDDVFGTVHVRILRDRPSRISREERARRELSRDDSYGGFQLDEELGAQPLGYTPSRSGLGRGTATRRRSATLGSSERSLNFDARPYPAFGYGFGTPSSPRTAYVSTDQLGVRGRGHWQSGHEAEHARATGFAPPLPGSGSPSSPYSASLPARGRNSARDPAHPPSLPIDIPRPAPPPPSYPAISARPRPPPFAFAGEQSGDSSGRRRYTAPGVDVLGDILANQQQQRMQLRGVERRAAGAIGGDNRRRVPSNAGGAQLFDDFLGLERHDGRRGDHQHGSHLGIRAGGLDHDRLELEQLQQGFLGLDLRGDGGLHRGRASDGLRERHGERGRSPTVRGPRTRDLAQGNPLVAEVDAIVDELAAEEEEAERREQYRPATPDSLNSSYAPVGYFVPSFIPSDHLLSAAERRLRDAAADSSPQPAASSSPPATTTSQSAALDPDRQALLEADSWRPAPVDASNPSSDPPLTAAQQYAAHIRATRRMANSSVPAPPSPAAAPPPAPNAPSGLARLRPRAALESARKALRKPAHDAPLRLPAFLRRESSPAATPTVIVPPAAGPASTSSTLVAQTAPPPPPATAPAPGSSAPTASAPTASANIATAATTRAPGPAHYSDAYRAEAASLGIAPQDLAVLDSFGELNPEHRRLAPDLQRLNEELNTPAGRAAHYARHGFWDPPPGWEAPPNIPIASDYAPSEEEVPECCLARCTVM